jgi:hypothetical protein
MIQGLFSRHTRLVGIVSATLGIAVLSGAPARASLINTSACDNATLTQPFSGWADANYYKAVPGGSFESGAAGWTLSKGAHIVAGSEPFGATGSVGSASLDLPAGASATAPFTCVDAAYPTFRFFGHNAGLASSVAVSVIYHSSLLGNVTVPVGVVALSANWQPSLALITASTVPGMVQGGTAQVALRFTAVSGESQIDDAFVDPKLYH